MSVYFNYIYLTCKVVTLFNVESTNLTQVTFQERVTLGIRVPSQVFSYCSVDVQIDSKLDELYIFLHVFSI